MKFVSTRDIEKKTLYSSAEVIKMGLAPDGGLFIPTEIPHIDEAFIRSLCKCSYYERAAKVLSLYLTDYDYKKLLADCKEAYSETSFEGGAAPVVKINEKIYTLELWHGPTAAFKDMALQIMPRLLSTALKMTGETRTALILVATSGDTGKAALEGYKDIDGVKIMVFYPNDGVSTVQKLQMATQTGQNVNVCAIYGNFDDAQNGVKAIFSDVEISKLLDDNGYFLSSANSINWGRLAPQIAYYISAYCDMINSNEIKYGETLDVCVPTGNFGNIFAAYLAKLMGLPIGKLVCASNSNNVLTDFLADGTYNRIRKFELTMSPSMDILISSNLERLLAFTAGPDKTQKYMSELSADGKYTVDAETKAKIDENFAGYYADESQTAKAINETFNSFDYLCDTHTGVAMFCAFSYLSEHTERGKILVASTASPYKFAKDVYHSVTGRIPESDICAIDMLRDFSGTSVPRPLADLDKREIRFKRSIDPKNMKEEILEYLKIK